MALIVESSDDAIIAKTLEGTILTWNAAAERLYGYSAGEVVGSSVSILVPPESIDELPHLLARIRQGEQVAHYENYAGQERRPAHSGVSGSFAFERCPREHCRRLLPIARDITDRNRAEDAYAKVRLGYPRPIETTHDVVWAVDANGRITFLNQGEARRVYGRDPQEFPGAPFSTSLSRRSATSAGRIASSGRRRAGATTNRAPRAPRRRHAPLALIPVDRARDPQGRVSGFFGSSQNITEQRRAEEALRQSEKVRVEAEKLAATGRVAARIAHEINNPLAGIKNRFT